MRHPDNPWGDSGVSGGEATNTTESVDDIRNNDGDTVSGGREGVSIEKGDGGVAEAEAPALARATTSHVSSAGSKVVSGANPIFINEDLTFKRSELLWQARKSKREGKVKDCWSVDGNIYVKDKHGVIKTIKNLVELRHLM